MSRRLRLHCVVVVDGLVVSAVVLRRKWYDPLSSKQSAS